MSFLDYLHGVSGGGGVESFAEISNVPVEVVEGWREGELPSARHVIRLAHAYRRPGLEALVAAGIIPADIAESARWPKER